MELNLLPDLYPHNEISNRGELTNYLLENYNQSSKFFASLAMDTMTLHLYTRDGTMPPAEEVAWHLDDITHSFYRKYLVKPTLKQLAFAGVEQAYYAHSHQVPIPSLFKLDSPAIIEVERTTT